MRRLLIAFATTAIAATPAVAQSRPTAEEASEKAKYVEKVVCERVEEERSTGSRLSATTKVCRKIKVPVDKDGAGNK